MKVPEASCYPPALSSRIKGSPLRETRKQGSEERRPGYRRNTRAARVHCFSGGQERPRQGRGGEEGARTRGPPDSARCPLGASGAPAPPLGYEPGGPGLGPAFPDAATESSPPPPPAPVLPTATSAGLTTVTLLHGMAKDGFPPRKQR